MKKNSILLLSLLVLLISGCKDPEFPNLELSETAFIVDDLASNITVNINSNSSWTVNGKADWCVPNKTEGIGHDVLTIALSANTTQTERKAELSVASPTSNKTIQITQSGTIHYKLPMIFHVLYADKNDNHQNVSKGRLAEILTMLNRIYKNIDPSIDLNLEFTLATIDPKTGKTLSEPGVERIYWDKAYPIDPNEFMNNNTGMYTHLLWDPNEYINVMIYNFTQDPETKSTILGIANLPYTTEAHFLEGLNRTKHPQISLENLKQAHSIAINSLYIYEQHNEQINPEKTLAHEMGHYLGLFHVFAEDNEGALNSCIDSDYCEDTPSYNRVQYDIDYMYAYDNQSTEPEKWTYDNWVQRRNCQHDVFISNNIMDYEISNLNQLTVEQRARIRHVLSYSPLIPGPKKGQTKAGTAPEGPVDLPFRTIK